MAISRLNRQSGPAEPAHDACETAGRLDGECKILPFRQSRLRGFSGSGELAGDCAAVEPDEEERLEARRNFLAVCLPEYPEANSCRGPFLFARWLKRLLLLSTFTAWTAAAIAVAIALD
jgi:hypothetical protein